MDKVATLKQTKLNCKVPIIVLSIVSLVFTLLGSLSYFVEYYSSWGTGGDIDSVRINFAISEAQIIDLLLTVILPAIPMVLFIVYIFAFYQKQKAKFVMLIIFITTIALRVFYSTVSVWLGTGGPNDLFYIFDYDAVLGIRVVVIPIISLTIATISALQGFSKKPLFVVGMMIVLFLETCNFILLFDAGFEVYMEQGMYIYTLCSISHHLGVIAFCVALLLFGLKNKTPAIISPKLKTTSKNKLDPTYSLKTLKDELEMGIITEEEYQSRRAEILSKL